MSLGKERNNFTHQDIDKVKHSIHMAQSMFKNCLEKAVCHILSTKYAVLFIKK
jgi:hypothetical protein